MSADPEPPKEAHAPDSSNLQPTPTGRTLVGGVAWIASLRWTAQVLTWVSTLVVVRLLAPGDYGIAALALAVVSVVTVLAEFGLGTAVISARALSPVQVAQLNGAALGLAVLASLVVLVGSPVAARFYREPLLAGVLPLLSLVFVAEGARVVPVAMLSRALRYRDTAIIDFAKSLVTATLVLTLALRGVGYWALILGYLGGSLVSAGWVISRHRQPYAWPTRAGLGALLQLARHVVIGRSAWILYRTADVFVAGRLFGAGLLGYYTMAWTVASLPGEKLGNVLTAATAPFFGAIQSDRQALRHYFVRVSETLALVLYPLLFGFLCVADLAVPLVLGEQWRPSVPVLRVLICYAAIQGVTTPVSQILTVTGHARTVMRAGLIALAVLPPAFFVGGRMAGILGVALGWLLVYPLVAWYPLSAALRVLALPVRDYIGGLRVAFEGAITMALAVLGFRALPWPSGSDWLELGGAIVAGGLGYTVTVWRRSPEALTTLLRTVRRSPGPLPKPSRGPGGNNS